MATYSTYTNNWDLVSQFLPCNWEGMAKSLGAIVRERRFNPESLLRLLLINLSDDCSLRESVVRAKIGNLVDVSDVALLKRLRASSEWLRWMTIEMLNRDGISTTTPDFLSEYHVKTVDATVVSEPGSTGTDWRVHYALDLFSLRCDQFILSRQDLGESFVNFKVEPNDLFIGDRAYGTLTGLRHVNRGGGEFLVRLRNRAFNLYRMDGRKIDLLTEAQPLRIGEVKELPVYSAPDDDGTALKMRLNMVQMSDLEAEKSIRRATKEQKKKQRSVNDSNLALHRYVILLTSLPETVTKHQVVELYRLRWQIELSFKRLKSIMGLGHLPKTDIESCRAWLNGKLLVSQLVQAIIEAGQNISPWGYPIRACAERLA